MINNNSQISCIPSETIVDNNSNEMDLNPLLSTEVIITSQPIVQVNPIYMITDRIPTMNQRQQPQQPNTFTQRRAQQQQQTIALNSKTTRSLARTRMTRRTTKTATKRTTKKSRTICTMDLANNDTNSQL